MSCAPVRWNVAISSEPARAAAGGLAAVQKLPTDRTRTWLGRAF